MLAFWGLFPGSPLCLEFAVRSYGSGWREFVAAEPELLLSSPPAHLHSVKVCREDSSQLLCPQGTPNGTIVRKMLKLNDSVAGEGRDVFQSQFHGMVLKRIFKDSGLMRFKILGTFPIILFSPR